MGVTVKSFCELIAKKGHKKIFVKKNGKSEYMVLCEAMHQYKNAMIDSFELLPFTITTNDGAAIELQYVVTLCD